MPATRTSEDLAYVTSLVREHDRPRYYAVLFAPAEARPDLFALYGFAVEIARVPDQVRDVALGEIRLRWWQDALTDATVAGGVGGTPALRAIADTISRRRLPLAAFTAMIEARSADLYSDPPATVADLEGYLGETESALFQMAAIVLGGDGTESAEAAGHAGIAYGLARRLSLFASEPARGRGVLPADLLERRGLTAGDLSDQRVTTAPVVGDVVQLARRQLVLAQDGAGKLRPQLRTAFLPLAVVTPLLKRIAYLKEDAALADTEVSDLKSLFAIGIAHLLGFRVG